MTKLDYASARTGARLPRFLRGIDVRLALLIRIALWLLVILTGFDFLSSIRQSGRLSFQYLVGWAAIGAALVAAVRLTRQHGMLWLNIAILLLWGLFNDQLMRMTEWSYWRYVDIDTQELLYILPVVLLIVASLLAGYADVVAFPKPLAKTWPAKARQLRGMLGGGVISSIPVEGSENPVLEPAAQAPGIERRGRGVNWLSITSFVWGLLLLIAVTLLFIAYFYSRGMQGWDGLGWFFGILQLLGIASIGAFIAIPVGIVAGLGGLQAARSEPRMRGNRLAIIAIALNVISISAVIWAVAFAQAEFARAHQ